MAKKKKVAIYKVFDFKVKLCTFCGYQADHKAIYKNLPKLCEDCLFVEMVKSCEDKEYNYQ